MHCIVQCIQCHGEERGKNDSFHKYLEGWNCKECFSGVWKVQGKSSSAVWNGKEIHFSKAGILRSLVVWIVESRRKSQDWLDLCKERQVVDGYWWMFPFCMQAGPWRAG